jgi:hypothetical protein
MIPDLPPKVTKYHKELLCQLCPTYIYDANIEVAYEVHVIHKYFAQGLEVQNKGTTIKIPVEIWQRKPKDEEKMKNAALDAKLKYNLF